MKYKQLRASIMFGHTLCYNRLGKVTLNRTWTSDQVQILKKMETKFLPIINIWVILDAQQQLTLLLKVQFD